MLFLGAGGFAAQQQSYGIFNVKALPYAATGNTVMLADGAMSAGSPAFSSPSASFAPADVGKTICVGRGHKWSPLDHHHRECIWLVGHTQHELLYVRVRRDCPLWHRHTAAIQSAINAVFSAGTGIVYSRPAISDHCGGAAKHRHPQRPAITAHIPLLSPQVTIGFVGHNRAHDSCAGTDRCIEQSPAKIGLHSVQPNQWQRHGARAARRMDR